MLEASNYSALETMRDGRPVQIRALKPNDEADLLAAVRRSSAKSLYRRFFGLKRHFSEQEIAFFLNVDLVSLAGIAREAGLKELTAEVLPDNISMLRVFEKSGLRLSRQRGSQVVHVTLQL